MPDLTAELLPALKKHRLPGLELPADMVAPKYDGHSILNIPAAVCHWLGAPAIGEASPLAPEILGPLGQDVKRVILVLMDALALHRLQRYLADGRVPVWESLLGDGLLTPLTSISPSTTSAALTTFWTGQSAASHGVMGYEVWLKEYGMIANMILHAPMRFRGEVGSLTKAGFDAAQFLLQPTLGPHLRQQGVMPYAFQHRSIASSGLSQMFQRETEIYGFQTPADLWISMRQLIEQKPHERQYIWTYWGEYDGLSHYFGPDDERTGAEFAHFSAAFEQFFIDKLSPAQRKDTLILLTADHGQIYTPLKPAHSLKYHPELVNHLHITPTGENRLTYFYLKPGSEAFVRDYLTAHWPQGLTILTREGALDTGLFGPGAHHPGLQDRIGDLIVISHEDAYFWWDPKDDFMFGRHGGLHAEEMLVPFLAARL